MYQASNATPTTPRRSAVPPEESAVSRWSFRVALLTFLFAVASIVLILIWHIAYLPSPSWATAMVGIVTAIDVMLAGTAVALSMGVMLPDTPTGAGFRPRGEGQGFCAG